MSSSAIVMMIIGMVVIWGGWLASIVNIIRTSKKEHYR